MQTLTKLHKGSIHSKIISGKRTFLPIDKEGLILYLPMESRVGNTIYDESKNNNNGTITGAIKANGKIGKALHFDNIDDVVNCGDIGTLNAPFTVSAWGYFDQITQADYDYIFFSGTDVNSCSISRTITTNTFYCYAGSANGGMLTGPALSGQQWLHITIVADTSTPYLKLYINAVSKTVEQPPNVITSNGEVWLGVYKGGAGTHHMKGTIDEVKVYNKTLSPEEILAIYNKEK